MEDYQINELGYEGCETKRAELIKRMEKHKKLDEISWGSGYFYSVTNGIHGCAVACIACEDLQTEFEGQAKLSSIIVAEMLHHKVDKLLNIPNIGVIIDILHENQRRPGPNFSVKVLKVLKCNVDYSELIESYIDIEKWKELSQAETAYSYTRSREGRNIPDALDRRSAMFTMLRDNKKSATGFIKFIKEYNVTHTVKGIDL